MITRGMRQTVPYAKKNKDKDILPTPVLTLRK